MKHNSQHEQGFVLMMILLVLLLVAVIVLIFKRVQLAAQ